MNLNFTEPRKNYRGLWEVTVTDSDGRVVEIVQKTTKKSMLTYMKERSKTK